MHGDNEVDGDGLLRAGHKVEQSQLLKLGGEREREEEKTKAVEVRDQRPPSNDEELAERGTLSAQYMAGDPNLPRPGRYDN